MTGPSRDQYVMVGTFLLRPCASEYIRAAQIAGCLSDKVRYRMENGCEPIHGHYHYRVVYSQTDKPGHINVPGEGLAGTSGV